MTDYGLRRDGTPKGEGYFGPILGPWGDHVTELSAHDYDDQGNEVLYPLIVPTLSHYELLYLVNGWDDNPEVLRGIYGKAREHALYRRTLGRSVWAEPGELFPLPSPPLPDPESSQAPAPMQ